MSTSELLTPYQLSSTIQLKNKIVMAPLTRCFADDDLAPTQLIADYYTRRAETGLIISEGTVISPSGVGYPNVPGIFNEKQITQWKIVTDQVHAEGGKIFCQLWHVGRVSHASYLKGELPVAPSAVSLSGRIPRTELEYGEVRELETDEVHQLIEAFKQGALNAIKAGFDGVEIHGANGYLVDQFLHQHTNKRVDEFGGSTKARAKFALDVIKDVSQAIGPDKVGIRLSPGAYFNQEHTDGDEKTYQYLLEQLNDKNLAYVHTGVFDDTIVFDYLGSNATSFLRKYYTGNIIASGGYTADKASAGIENNQFDLIAIGRDIIANPDYVEKLRTNQKLVEYDAATLTTLY